MECQSNFRPTNTPAWSPACLSDHYNPKVLSDVRFWLKQLETSNGVISIDVGGVLVEISARLLMFEGYSDSLEEQQDDHLDEG